MSERTALITRVWKIATRLNISQARVDIIVKSFLKFCREQLKSGHRVDIEGVVTVVPDYEVCDYWETFSYKCMLVSEEVNEPIETVTQVLRGYIDTVKKDLLSGIPANIYGILTITPYNENGVITRVHSAISQSLQEELRLVNNHARVHTNKMYKRALKGVAIVDR